MSRSPAVSSLSYPVGLVEVAGQPVGDACPPGTVPPFAWLQKTPLVPGSGSVCSPVKVPSVVPSPMVVTSSWKNQNPASLVPSVEKRSAPKYSCCSLLPSRYLIANPSSSSFASGEDWLRHCQNVVAPSSSEISS